MFIHISVLGVYTLIKYIYNMIINLRKERTKQRKKRHISRVGLAKWLYGIMEHHVEVEDSKFPLPAYEDFKDWLLSQENFEWKYFNWEDHGFSDRHAFPHIRKIDKTKGYTLDNIKLT